MNNLELIKELRVLTSAGMKDCKEALEEANWDLQKAQDLIKVKGLNIADGRVGQATEGKIGLLVSDKNDAACMVEINSQTDFVSNSQNFTDFVSHTLAVLSEHLSSNKSPFKAEDVEAARKEVVAKTKENVVVRRWCIEEAQSPNVKVFGYQHSNHKIGVIITMSAPSEELTNTAQFQTVAEDLAMQVAAMNPLAVSAERLSSEDIGRQKSIFEAQLKEDGKPETMWPRILEGKFSKWNREVCLLEQESVVVPKTTVKQVLKKVSDQIGGEVQVVNFLRFQVGQGLQNASSDLAEEVNKLMNQNK